MRLKSIHISNYKTIENLTIPIEKVSNSFLGIFIGKNETGKTNILEAIALASQQKGDYQKCCRHGHNGDVIVDFDLDLTEDERSEFNKSVLPFDGDLIDFSISSIIRRVALQKNGSIVSDYLFDVYHRDVMITPKCVIPPKNTPGGALLLELNLKGIVDVEYFNELLEETNPVSGERDLLREQYHLVTESRLKEIFSLEIKDYLKSKEIKIQIWTSKDSLLRGSIDLTTFAKNPASSPVLQNIFSLLDPDLDIMEKIEEIKDNSKRRSLERQLSSKTTDHINKIWKEHEIKIDARIERDMSIFFSVEDKDNPEVFCDMDSRSSGFKQFVSLLLTISASNETGALNNNLILIDEPEVHLHPSGIEYLREELKKIGKNNYLLVATHSVQMVDTENSERHFIVEKIKGATKIRKVSYEENMLDDKIMMDAYGVNIIRMLLQGPLLLVEGLSDKKLIERALHHTKYSEVRVMNSQGNNLGGFATLCGAFEIKPYVLVDDDKKGKDMKNLIIEKWGGGNEHLVLTLHDLNNEMISGGTIEDLLDRKYVREIVNQELKNREIGEIDDKNETLPIIGVVKEHVKSKGIKDTRDIMNTIKTNISNNCSVKNSPGLIQLAENLVEKIQINQES